MILKTKIKTNFDRMDLPYIVTFVWETENTRTMPFEDFNSKNPHSH